MADVSSTAHDKLTTDACNEPFDLKLTAEVWRGREGLEQLREHWWRLAKRCGSHYLHFPDWYRQKLAFMEDDSASCYFLTYFSDNCLVAVLPLKWQRETVGRHGLSLTLRSWQLYLPDEMGVCDATIDPAYRRSHLLQRIHSDLDSLGLPWDVLNLRHLPETSHLLALCRNQSHWQVVTKPSHPSKFLPADRSYDALMEERFSKKFRRNLRRKQNKLERMGEVSYEFVREPSQLKCAFREFVEVEASGWKGDKGSALAHQADKKQMYEQLVESLASTDNIGINLLKLDGKAIAGQVAVYAGDSVYLLKIGYDEDFNSVSPGFLLVNELLTRACASQSLQRLSFVTGVGWMDVWKPEAETVYCAYRFRRRLWNGLAQGMMALQAFKDRSRT